MNLADRIKAACNVIIERANCEPRVGIILGTGLGGLSEEVEGAVRISYDQIPHFPRSTVVSHRGELVLGTLEGKPVVVFDGRFHFYEGYGLEEITFPVRVIKALGAGTMLISNASGGMNPLHRPGDIIIIDDHINLMGVNPLIGPNDDDLGPRFPDMCAPYDRDLSDLAERLAREEGIRAFKGIFVAVSGPNLETRAEYRFLRAIGADIVGMSTVPEVIAGVHAGLRILGLSVVTDSCLPDALRPVNVEEIIAVANSATPRLTRLVRSVVREI